MVRTEPEPLKTLKDLPLAQAHKEKSDKMKKTILENKLAHEMSEIITTVIENAEFGMSHMRTSYSDTVEHYSKELKSAGYDIVTKKRPCGNHVKISWDNGV
jgi:hypothetical protein